MDFAQRLAELLKKENMTAYRLSKTLNVHQTSVKNWLEGKSKPRTEYVEKLATHFGVSIDYLMGQTDNPKHEIQARLDIPLLEKNISQSETINNNDKKLVYQLNIMLKYAPNVILSCLSKLFRNERIEKDLTERFLAQAAQIPLEAYLLFETTGEGLLPEQIIDILKALNLNSLSVIGTLRGVVVASLKEQSISPEEFLYEFDNNGLLTEATLMMAAMDSETLQLAIAELKKIYPDIKNGNDIIAEKVQNAYLDTLKNRPQK